MDTQKVGNYIKNNLAGGWGEKQSFRIHLNLSYELKIACYKKKVAYGMTTKVLSRKKKARCYCSGIMNKGICPCEYLYDHRLSLQEYTHTTTGKNSSFWDTQVPNKSEQHFIFRNGNFNSFLFRFDLEKSSEWSKLNMKWLLIVIKLILSNFLEYRCKLSDWLI